MNENQIERKERGGLADLFLGWLWAAASRTATSQQQRRAAHNNKESEWAKQRGKASNLMESIYWWNVLLPLPPSLRREWTPHHSLPSIPSIHELKRWIDWELMRRRGVEPQRRLRWLVFFSLYEVCWLWAGHPPLLRTNEDKPREKKINFMNEIRKKNEGLNEMEWELAWWENI